MILCFNSLAGFFPFLPGQQVVLEILPGEDVSWQNEHASSTGQGNSLGEMCGYRSDQPCGAPEVGQWPCLKEPGGPG